MNSDAIRIVADFYDDLWEPERTITADDLHRFMYRLADQFQANPKTQTAIPNAREVLKAFATFGEQVSDGEAPGLLRVKQLAARLAKEARAALAEPETGIVAELVAACEAAKDELASYIQIDDVHSGHETGLQLNRQLSDVIAKATTTTTKGKP